MRTKGWERSAKASPSPSLILRSPAYPWRVALQQSPLPLSPAWRTSITAATSTNNRSDQPRSLGTRAPKTGELTQWIKSIPSTSLRSKHFFYLNRLSPRLWIVIGLAVYVVVKIQVAYPNTALIPSIGLKLMLSMGQSMISAFIFFVIVHHYTTHAKRDKEHRQLASDLYDVLLSSCSFLHIPDEKLRTYVPKDFQRTLYELEDKIEKGDKDGLDVLRHKAQRDLLLCLMGLYRVSRYSLDHDFDAKLNEAIYHLRIVVDPSPQYDRDTYRLTVCRYYTALSELIDEYGYDYSKRGHVVLTKRSYMQRRNVFYEPI